MGRVFPLTVMEGGFAVERPPPGREKGGFPFGTVGLPHMQGKRDDFLSMFFVGAPLGEDSCGVDGYHKCEGRL